MSISIPFRKILQIGPIDKAIRYLQSNSTANVLLISENIPVYSFFLCPKGRYLCDAIICKLGEYVTIEYDSRNEIHLMSVINRCSWNEEFFVYGQFDVEVSVCNERNGAKDSFHNFQDPTHPMFGTRCYSAKKKNSNENEVNNSYRELCIKHEVPDGYIDMISNNCFITSFFPLPENSLDMKKGCFVGAETVARMLYRLNAKRSKRSVKIKKVMEQIDENSNGYIKTIIQSDHEIAVGKISARAKKLNDKCICCDITSNGNYVLEEKDCLIANFLQ